MKNSGVALKRLVVTSGQLRVAEAGSESRGFCGTGKGGGIDNSCSSKDGGGGGGSKTGPLLDRASQVFVRMNDTETPLGKAADSQMRGGVMKPNGEFAEFSGQQKERNLKALQRELNKARDEDPEAFEAARQMAIAEVFGVDSYDSLPDTLTVYRGHDVDEQMGSITNVTAKREVAEKFGASGVVSEHTVAKEDIVFPLTNSVFQEAEIIVTRQSLGVKTQRQTAVQKANADHAAWMKGVKPGQRVNGGGLGDGTLVGAGPRGSRSVVVRLDSGETITFPTRYWEKIS